jgi:hypothetical protein
VIEDIAFIEIDGEYERLYVKYAKEKRVRRAPPYSAG